MHLEKMGHSIGERATVSALCACPLSRDCLVMRCAAGTRLIDEMLAKTSIGGCADFKVGLPELTCWLCCRAACPLTPCFRRPCK
jgi:hypothetical protein